MADPTQSVEPTDPLASLDGPRFIRPQKDLGGQATELTRLLANALAEPIYYPPLSDSVFPGDTVAIALQRDLPRPREVLNAILDQLQTLNIEPSDITVVLPGSLADLFDIPADQAKSKSSDDDQPDPPPVFPLQREFHSIQCQVHDPENAAGLAYLVANEAGDPVHMNRILVDADVVIPVGCPSSHGDATTQDCLYPTFGSSATIARYGGGSSIVSRLEETELANNTLGAFFEIQLVAGPQDTIADVICGVRKDAVAAANEKSGQLWEVACDTTHDAALVTVESRAHDQTWRDFSTALINASKVTAGDAPIAIWTELSVSPDRSTRKACLARFENTIPAKLSKTLQHVAGILKDRPVYVRSNLSRAAIEELGLSVLETTDEIDRLTQSAASCIVLRDAHLCRFNLPEVATDVE